VNMNTLLYYIRSSLVCLLHSDSGIQLICIAKATGPGLVIKGGANHAEGPMVFIQEIVPGGDSQKDGRLQVGDQLVSINKESLIGVTYEEARSILTRTKLRSKHKITEHLLSKALDLLGLKPSDAQRQALRSRLPADRSGTVAFTNQLIVFLFLFIFLFLLLLLLFLFLLFLFLSVLLSLQGVKLEAEESRALRIRIQLAEEAQKQARGMEMDYEEVIHLLEAEIAELKTQRAEPPSEKKDELKKKVAVLECQLRKSEAAKKGFELSTGKLLSFVETKHTCHSNWRVLNYVNNKYI
uniref:PDZ domain-containing protein n=1 Tax=Cyclopterus lumpus TaxID=8103 RepID=A0A8C2X280_CYCLU